MRTSPIAVVVCALAPFASADQISFASDNANSTEGLGSFTGTIDYTPATATLIITITNSPDTSPGGKITGLVFNIGGADASASATLQSADFPFDDTGQEPAPPFGDFDAGAALGAKWTGSGSPNPGIHIGETGTFTFDIHASDAAALTAIDFLDGSGADVNFAVRFRGFDNGGSDKVPGVNFDCDSDGIPDSDEQDCDGNGTPDDCETRCGADFAAPSGVFNIFDFLAFQTAFTNGDPCADVAAPFGTLNLFDFLEFQRLFGECDC